MASAKAERYKAELLKISTAVGWLLIATGCIGMFFGILDYSFEGISVSIGTIFTLVTYKLTGILVILGVAVMLPKAQPFVLPHYQRGGSVCCDYPGHYSVSSKGTRRPDNGTDVCY